MTCFLPDQCLGPTIPHTEYLSHEIYFHKFPCQHVILLLGDCMDSPSSGNSCQHCLSAGTSMACSLVCAQLYFPSPCATPSSASSLVWFSFMFPSLFCLIPTLPPAFSNPSVSSPNPMGHTPLPTFSYYPCDSLLIPSFIQTFSPYVPTVNMESNSHLCVSPFSLELCCLFC